MKNYARIGTVLTVLLCSLRPAMASPLDLGVSMGGGYGGLKPAVVDAQDLGKDSGLLDLRGDLLINKRIYLAVGGLFTFYQDHNSFSQLTKSSYGEISDDTSRVIGISGYVMGGYHCPFANHFYAGLNGGVLFSGDPKRSIPNCTDCQEENIDIGGTQPFVAPVIGYYAAPGIKMELEYRRLINGRPFEQMALLSLGYMWRVKD